MTAANAALDLAHVSQTSPRTQFANRLVDSREQSSEWPQFTGVPRGPDAMPRSERRNVTNPNLTLSGPTDEVPKSTAGISPIIQQLSQGHSLSRRNSPPNLLENLNANTRSVPGTPLGLPTSAAHLLKTPGTPLTSDLGGLNGRIGTPNSQLNDEIQASLSRMPSTGPDSNSLVYNTIAGGRDDVRFKVGSSSNFLTLHSV